MKNIGKIMEQVQQMQSDMKAAQDRLALMEVEGQSGAGLVKVKMNAKAKMDQLTADEMGKVTQGLSLPPGMQMPF